MRIVYPALALLDAEGFRNDGIRAFIEEIIEGRQEDLGGLDVQSPGRLMRESWGPMESESRTLYVCKGVTLSSSGAGYDHPPGQDLPLTAELVGDRHRTDRSDSARCYFVPDDEHDPYGRNDHHCIPLLWAAAQDRGDALGVVLYRPRRHRRLESHFVMSLDVDEIRVGGKDWTNKFPVNANGSGDRTAEAISPNKAVVLRKGSAAVGVRVVWARNVKGEQASMVLCYDGAPDFRGREGRTIRSVRLTVLHHVLEEPDKQGAWTSAGAAFWVRIAHEVGDFGKWCEAFAAAEMDPVEEQMSTVRLMGKARKVFRHLKIGANSGRLGVDAYSPNGRRFVTMCHPRPSQAVLETDGGEDVGRFLLKGIALIETYGKDLDRVPAVALPAAGSGTYWEAADGRVTAPMKIGKRKGLSVTRYVWMPPEKGRRGSDAGSVTWRLDVPEGGKSCYIWGRILAPRGGRNAFRVRVFGADGGNAASGSCRPGIWRMGVYKKWTWVPMDLSETGESAGPTRLDLPEGEVDIQLFPRKAGIKVDRLFITDRADDLPASTRRI